MPREKNLRLKKMMMIKINKDAIIYLKKNPQSAQFAVCMVCVLT